MLVQRPMTRTRIPTLAIVISLNSVHFSLPYPFSYRVHICNRICFKITACFAKFKSDETKRWKKGESIPLFWSKLCTLHPHPMGVKPGRPLSGSQIAFHIPTHMGCNFHFRNRNYMTWYNFLRIIAILQCDISPNNVPNPQRAMDLYLHQRRKGNAEHGQAKYAQEGNDEVQIRQDDGDQDWSRKYRKFKFPIPKAEWSPLMRPKA